jgi:ABC-2 type transport system permease protein
MIAIWRRELRAYFVTPVGYACVGVFLALSSLFFYVSVLERHSSDLLSFILQMSYLWMLMCPVLTMRLFAEERQRRTDQLLFTCPVSLTRVTLGKYLAAVTVLTATVLLTWVYAAVVAAYGAVYPGELLTGYLGFLLQGCAFAAVDLLVSCLSRSAVTAAVAALGVKFGLWMMDLLADTVPVWLGDALSFLSLYSRNEPFLMGQLSPASVLYDLSVTALALALTVYVLDRRRRA